MISSADPFAGRAFQSNGANPPTRTRFRCSLHNRAPRRVAFSVTSFSPMAARDFGMPIALCTRSRPCTAGIEPVTFLVPSVQGRLLVQQAIGFPKSLFTSPDELFTPPTPLRGARAGTKGSLFAFAVRSTTIVQRQLCRATTCNTFMNLDSSHPPKVKPPLFIARQLCRATTCNTLMYYSLCDRRTCLLCTNVYVHFLTGVR